MERDWRDRLGLVLFILGAGVALLGVALDKQGDVWWQAACIGSLVACMIAWRY